MSFKKNFAQHIPLVPETVNSIFNQVKEFISKKNNSGFEITNKEIVVQLRTILKNESIEISQQKTYEILSMLMGFKNYNIAIAKKAKFTELFNEEKKVKIPYIDNFNETKPNKSIISVLDFIKTLPNSQSTPSLFKIPTGIRSLDSDLQGGLPSEGLTTILAGTNAGKSLFSISLGANAIRLGKKVLHINLEGQRDEALTRYVANLSDIEYSKIIQNQLSPDEQSQITTVTKKHQNNLKIRNMIGFGVSIENVFSLCLDIFKTFKFEMIIVDFGQLLTTEESTNSYAQTMAKVFRGLDLLSKHFNCVVVSPVQTTRDSQLNQKNNVIKSTDISTAFEIARVSSVILSLNLLESLSNKMIVYLEKQRLGPKYKLYETLPNYSKCNLIN